MEIAQTAEGIEEAILNDVAGLFVVADNAAGNSEQTRRVGADQFLVRGIVARPQPGEQFRLVSSLRAGVILTLIYGLRHQAY